jgi:hypothetical protein
MYFNIDSTVTCVLQFPPACWVAERQILAFCRTEMLFRQKIVLARNALLAIPLQQTDLHTLSVLVLSIYRFSLALSSSW